MMPALTFRAKMSGRSDKYAAAAVRSSQRASAIGVFRLPQHKFRDHIVDEPAFGTVAFRDIARVKRT
jgi:hypothetical protein